MTWQINLTPQAEKDLSNIGTNEARRITRFLRERVLPDPKALGGPLAGSLREFWRYRVGHYRILAKIEEDQLIILVVRIGHRSKVYSKH